MANIALISLGCAKNQVNLEEMRHLLLAAGHTIVDEANGADFAVVNTCGFIDSAKAEAIGHVLELAAYKQARNLAHIIMTGCLSQRYESEIFTELPEVDGILGTGSYSEIATAVAQIEAGERVALFGDIHAPLETKKRAIANEAGWAYLKIAEGCDNHCAYCVIPSLRGRFRSRPLAGLLEEAEELTAAGVRELIIVAQDITQYGKDLTEGESLKTLITALAEIKDLTWIRLHYLYPEGIDEALIETIATTPKVLPYLDIPIQHISDKVLSKMNRRGTSAEIKALFTKLKHKIPNLVLRTSLITGLPYETEAEFEELAEFLLAFKLERVGVFPYSPQEGTAAEKMQNRVTMEEAERRAELLLDLQANVLDEFLTARIGREEEVLCLGFDPAQNMHYARSYAESPDVDGLIWIKAQGLETGKHYLVRYTDLENGELVANIPSEGQAK